MGRCASLPLVWAMTLALGATAPSYAGAVESLLSAQTFADARSNDPHLRDNALEKLIAAVKSARAKNQPVPVDVDKALIAMLKREADLGLQNKPNPSDFGDEEYLPSLLDVVGSLDDPASIDVLLIPWVLETGSAATGGVAKFGDRPAPTVLRMYDAPPLDANQPVEAFRTLKIFLL